MTANSIIPRPGRHIAGVLSAVLLLTGALTGCQDPLPPLPGEGSWRLVNYWAIWCAPCREEIPVLNEVNHWPEVQVLGVNFDNKAPTTRAQERETLGIRFSALESDPAERLGISRPQVLPTTLVVGPKGRVVDVLVGPQTTATLKNALTAAGYNGLTPSATPD